MFKGNNTITVNQSTMNRIVQEWIDRNIEGDNTVIDVSQRMDTSPQFNITISANDTPDCEDTDR